MKENADYNNEIKSISDSSEDANNPTKTISDLIQKVHIDPVVAIIGMYIAKECFCHFLDVTVGNGYILSKGENGNPFYYGPANLFMPQQQPTVAK